MKKIKDRIEEFLQTKSLCELEFIRARYCGPSNELLCSMVHGFSIPMSTIDRHISHKATEEILLGYDYAAK